MGRTIRKVMGVGVGNSLLTRFFPTPSGLWGWGGGGGGGGGSDINLIFFFIYAVQDCFFSLFALHNFFL